MNCQQLRESLASFLYDELDGSEQAAVKAHLASCAKCAAEVTELRRTMRAMDHWDAGVSAIDDVALARAMQMSGRRSTRGTKSVRRWVYPGATGAVAAALTFALLVATQARIERRDGMLEISFFKGQDAAVVGDSSAAASEFLLLILDQPTDASGVGPAEEEKRVTEYRNWARRIGGDGRMIDGQKLTESRYRLAADRGGTIETVALGPTDLASSGGIIGGYFRIGADSMDEALAVAKTCPHLAHGGRIEVREVDPRTR